MKKIIKILIYTIISIAILASLAGNIYYFGWLKLENYLLQKGAKMQMDYLINQQKQIQAQQNAEPTK